MATGTVLLGDPRRRTLAVMAAIAIVMIGLAALALWNQSAQTARHYQPHTFFPQLASRVREISHVRIRSKKGVIDVVFKPEKGWVVASQSDYPAAFDEIRQTVVGLSTLQTIEPRTSKPGWLHYLDLDAPPKGDGVLIALENEKGESIASVIVGKSEDIGDSTGATGLFVREPGSSQSWLVRSVFEPKSDPADWLDKQVLDVDRSRIQQVDVNPLNGPSFEVRREKRTDEDFMLVNPPKGREVAYAGAGDGVAAAVVGFTFDDVKPARDFDFSDPTHTARMVVHTFDGLTLTVHTIQQGKDDWATISADGTIGKADSFKDARNISGRVTGWAYKLPAYKGQLFMSTLESLLKPLNNQQPAKPAP